MPGKPVAGTAGDNAEPDSCTAQSFGCFVYSAVAAGCYNGLVPVCGCFACQTGGITPGAGVSNVDSVTCRSHKLAYKRFDCFFCPYTGNRVYYQQKAVVGYGSFHVVIIFFHKDIINYHYGKTLT